MTEQNNERSVSTEMSNSNGNGGNSKKVLIGIVALALIAAVVIFFKLSSEIKTPDDLLKVYAKTMDQMEKQVAYQKEMQKKYWTKQIDSKATLELKELPQEMLQFVNGKLGIGVKNDPENKRLQFSLDTNMGGKDLLSAKGELNDEELLIDFGEYSDKLLAFTTKDFGAKWKAYHEQQVGGISSADPQMDISYSKMIGQFNSTTTEIPKEYKEALSAMLEGVNVEKAEDGYRMIIPNENVRAGVKNLFEAMKNDSRLTGMGAGQAWTESFDHAIQSMEESTDDITLEVFTKVSDGIASELRVKVLKNGSEEMQSTFTIADTKEVLNDWKWVVTSAKDANGNLTVTGKGVLSKEKTDYAVNISASDQVSLSLNFAYGNPEASGDCKVEAKLMMNGAETMSFLLGGKYSNENGVQKFVSDVGTVHVKNVMSGEDSEVKFSLESETKEKVDSFDTFDKPKHLLFDSSKEENDEFVQGIMNMLFMKMMGL